MPTHWLCLPKKIPDYAPELHTYSDTAMLSRGTRRRVNSIFLTFTCLILVHHTFIELGSYTTYSET